MSFYTDLHVHSKYSRACSKDADLEHLTWWAQRKGIGLVGTGDFTHPAWLDHLRTSLVPAEPGLYALREDLIRDIDRTLPASVRAPVRFTLSVEISTIYKRGDRTRKVHHLVYLPDLDAVERFNRELGRIGNLGSDGRPILGLDSRDLLDITLNASPDGYLVPAHIWTPWFAVLGSKSGFDAIADCYLDLADHIFALETGLSSDPPMNWRISGLDRYRLVSNSDAHSPPMLGREASVFDTELSYYAVRDALRTGDGYAGSVEFYPEEGKYHLDGHRACQVRLSPAETREHAGRCPECGRPLTVGTLHRVEALADRPEGYRLEGAAGFSNLVPLPEITSEILGVGPKSKSVARAVSDLVAALGPEFAILRDVPIAEIERAGTPLLAEAIARLRRGEVIRDAGYDGEYGTIRLFEPDEVRRHARTPVLFDVELAAPEPAKPAARPAPAPVLDEPPLDLEVFGTGPAGGLDPDQRAAVFAAPGPMLVVAGPGTGKTRALTHRIAHLVTELDVPPERCLAVTFTRKAAGEMRDRLAELLPGRAERVLVTTFHGLGARLLRELAGPAGLPANFRIADESDIAEVLGEITTDAKEARALRAAVNRARSGGKRDADALDRYVKALRSRDLVDFDDLVALPAALLTEDQSLAEVYRARWTSVLVDEYQDTDADQYALLRALTGPDTDLCVIGDPDQSIYRFRGARVEFFLRFTEDYPGARTVTLSRNYRSTRPIVVGATSAIAPDTLVPDRVLTPVRHRSNPAPIGVYRASSEADEAEFVARTIDQLLGGSSFHSLDSARVDARGEERAAASFADIAVLYRTNARSARVVEALRRAGIPFQQRSHDRLADRPGVREIVAELRFEQPGDGQPGDLLDRIRRVARALAGRLPPYQRTADEHATELHTAVDLLAPLAREYPDSPEDFLAGLELGAEVDTLDQRADQVSLLTLHAAKGLEFPVVFVIGCEDGVLPARIGRKAADPEAVAEERRLFFVGLTRAREHLFVSHAVSRGRSRPVARSPFLDAIDQGVIERLNQATERRAPRPSQMRLL